MTIPADWPIMTFGEPLMHDRHRPFFTPIPFAALLILVIVLLLTAGTAAPGAAQTPGTMLLPIISGTRPFEATPVGDGFYIVTAITHAGDERLFIVERRGRIMILHPDGTQTTFLDWRGKTVANAGEFGMYDIAFHPGYADPASPGFGFIFVFYTGHEGDDIYSYISRIRVSADPDVADPSVEAWIFREQQTQPWHKGGELVFDSRDGLLYASVGEDAQPHLAQQLDTPKGKIIRLMVDDLLPTAEGDVTDLVDMEIMAIGLRNPYRFDLDPVTGRLFIGDVGENTWEEVSILEPDAGQPNFGWPCREGPAIYALYQNHPACQGTKTYTPPAAYMAHSDGHCAVIGGKYRQPNGGPGRFIYSDACSRDIFSLSQSGDVWVNTRLGTVNMPGMLTTIGEDVYGNLYLGNTASRGPIYRLTID